jgi:hypothetical protein
LDVSADAVAVLLALISVVPGGTIAGELALLVAAGAVSLAGGLAVAAASVGVVLVVAGASGVVVCVCAIAALPISAAAIRRGAFMMKSPCMSGLGRPVPPYCADPRKVPSRARDAIARKLRQTVAAMARVPYLFAGESSRPLP